MKQKTDKNYNKHTVINHNYSYDWSKHIPVLVTKMLLIFFVFIMMVGVLSAITDKVTFEQSKEIHTTNMYNSCIKSCGNKNYFTSDVCIKECNNMLLIRQNYGE
jgi:hypothetical protein